MIRRISLLSLAGMVAALFSIGSAGATTITFTNSGPTSPNFITSDDNPLANGSLVMVGSISNLSSPIITSGTARNIFDSGLFVYLGMEMDLGTADQPGRGTGTVTVNGAGGPGKGTGQILNVNNGGTFVAAGTKMAVFVVDATSTASISDSTEFGIFMAEGDQWNMPASNLSPLTMNPANVTVDAVRGSVVTDGGGTVVSLQLVPEPSASLLILGALAGMVGFHRRR